ncbi:CHAT domain-containing protein [Kouleothrix sp.]|uniref:CHAT domain-containing protein n=1 Tax=Kouleothrix sp. TaxID=2779161 RepID=UPI00391C265E
MAKEYVPFKIEFIDLDSARANVIVRCDLVGGDARGVFVSPSGDPAFQQLVDQLQNFQTDEDMLTELGRRLFGALFQGQVRDAYITARSKLRPDQGLRLRLSIEPAQTALAALPWEFLCDEEHQPLVLLDTPIVRYLPRFSNPPVLDTPRPLKILVTTAITEPKFDPASQLAELRATVASAEQAGVVQLHVEEHLTRRRFNQLLRQGFHIWHFIGHGKLNRDGTSGQLVFEDAGGVPDAIGARELGIILSDSMLRLIVLEACNSAQLTTQPYRSIAPALMLANIGAVIAMQFKAPQEATRPFADEFYQALVDGEPIDACVVRGRREVMFASGLRNPDWGIPTVYTRAPDARLFAPAAATAPTPGQPGTPQPAQGGISVSIGNNNQFGNSPININAGGGAAEGARYDDRLNELNRQLAATRSKRAILQDKKAKLQAGVGELILLEETEREYADQRRQLLVLRKERLEELRQRADQPASQALDGQIAELTLSVLEEEIDLTQSDVYKLEDLRRIQSNDRDRQKVQQQIDAKNAQIAELRRQLNAMR